MSLSRTATLLSTLLLIASPLTAQDEILLATYGPEASIVEGDDDFVQEFTILVPADAGPLWLRLFDPDIGGAHDDLARSSENRTRFRLLGAAGAAIADSEFGEDRLLDDRWNNLASFEPQDGEAIDGDLRRFVLVVEGAAGDGANLYNVAVSASDKQNVSPAGLSLTNLAPTIRLPFSNARAEMRFTAPQGAVIVRSFDAAGARLALDTAWRDDLRITDVGGQGVWAESRVELQADEAGELAALSFVGGAETPNDAGFALLDDAGRPLPIEIPIPLRRANRRPEPRLARFLVVDCETLVFDARETRDADNDLLDFQWTFGDGGDVARGERLSRTFSEPGEYPGTLLVRDDSGQVNDRAKIDFVAVVNRPPTAVLGEDLKAAPGDELIFDGSGSSDPDGDIVRRLWDFGDGTRVEGDEVMRHVYRETGLFRVKLHVEDDSDSLCNSADDTLEVWINAPPAVLAGFERRVSPSESHAYEPARARDPDGEIVRWQWDMGDGTILDGRNVEHAFAEPGVYNVVLTITDDADVANSEAQSDFDVIVNDPPEAVAGPMQRVAVDEVVTFDSAASVDRDGRLIAWQWEFGDGGASAGPVVSHVYDQPGRYEVRLVVRDDSTTTSDSAEDTTLVIVNDPPVSEAGVDRLVTSSTVLFDGSASHDRDGEIIAYQWNFGDGATSDEQNPTHVFARPGVYDVELKVTDDSGTSSRFDTSRMQVTVNARPTADAGADRIAAPGQKLSFDGSSSFDPDGEVEAWTWSFSDGANLDGALTEYAFSEPGLYTARLTVRDDTGHSNAFDDDEIQIRVNEPPRAAAGAPIVAAPGELVRLDGSASYDPDGEIIAWRWQIRESGLGAPLAENEGSSVDRAAIEHRFEEPGVYAAVLAVTDASGAPNARREDEVRIEINARPTALPAASTEGEAIVVPAQDAARGDDLITCSSRIVFDAQASTDPDGDSLSWIWDFGDGMPGAEGVRVSHTYAEGGVYPVLLTVDDGRGLSNSVHRASLTVRINEPPRADAGPGRSVCTGDPVLFTGAASRDPEGSALRYEWNFGDGETAHGLNPVKVYKEGGVFEVELRVSDDTGLACDQGAARVPVRVAQSPLADAGADIDACTWTPVQFDGSGSRDHVDGVVDLYAWDFGDGETGAGVKPIHIYEHPGTYETVLTITGAEIGVCDNTHSDPVTVRVIAGPEPRYVGPVRIAPGESAAFDASASSGGGRDIAAYIWDFGDGATVEGAQVEHAWTEPGRYPISLTVQAAGEGACRNNTVEGFIEVNAAPVAAAGGDRSAGVSEPVIFRAGGSDDPDGKITAYAWDFGDGETAEGFEAVHRYAEPGVYTATLTVTDDAEVANSTSTSTVAVRINSSPEPRIAAADAVCPGEEAAFDASASTDAEGDPLVFTWDFGDGASEASGERTTHRFDRPGLYQVTLIADDGKNVAGSRRSAVRAVRVNRSPLPSPGPSRIVCAGENVDFDGSRSTDPDGEIVSFSWDFGDGASGGGARTNHVYAAPGVYAAKLSVGDDSGSNCANASTSTEVRVNTPPAADAGGNREAFVGGAHDAIVFDASASIDADGDPMTFVWDFGDGTRARGTRVSHAYGSPGTYTVRLTARDDSGTECGAGIDEIVVEARQR